MYSFQEMDTAIFYGKGNRKSADLALPCDESEDELAFSDCDEMELNEGSEGESSEGESSESEAEESLESEAEESLESERKSIPAVLKWKGSIPSATELKQPVEYFRSLLKKTLMKEIVEQSNIYASQYNINKPLNLNYDELEQFIGICFHMSVHSLPGTRMYWARSTRVDCVADVMSLHRWEAIKRFLHFANNEEQVPAGEPGYDKLFKVRPLLSSLQSSFQSIPMSENLSADEQIVPFKGKSLLKQYNPRKPKRWGYKILVLADDKGIVHNFNCYTGPVYPVDGFPDIGASGNVMLQLATVIPRNMSHKLSTVIQSRLAGCTFMEDKQMKVKGRGTFEEKQTSDDNVTVRAVKWFDNRSVILLSTFAAANPTTMVERWDKKRNEVVAVTCPNIVTVYNKSMGGVDLLDSLIKKWYLRIVFHMLDLTAVQAWLLYRRDCRALGVQEKLRKQRRGPVAPSVPDQISWTETGAHGWTGKTHTLLQGAAYRYTCIFEVLMFSCSTWY
uniref:PiggyBac transposable element-derived protein domain-containing protein n=1 Tax=Sinocyclocheilus rhinocerous TaxID=307959 RepID=A0A673JYK2_9TELE